MGAGYRKTALLRAFLCVSVAKSERQRSASDYLFSLSTHNKSLQSVVLDVLLDAVADVAGRLRRTACAANEEEEDEQSLPWQLENIAHVLDCVERVLAAAVDQRGVVDAELRRRVTAQLDLSLQHVASAFPLFAYRVWQLAGGLADDDDGLRSADDSEMSIPD